MKLPSLSAWLFPASALVLAGVAIPRSHAETSAAPVVISAPSGAPGAAIAPVPATYVPPSSVAVDSGAAAPAPAVAAPPSSAPAAAAPPSAAPPVAAAPTGPRPALGEMRLDPATGRYVAPYGGGRAVLTVDARLQARLERILADNAVPYGATVLLEPATGRVLALAEYSRAEPAQRGLPLRAIAPAASVFKIVTSAALLEKGIATDTEVCFHGGQHRLQPRLLADDPRRDHRCTSLATAFGKSTNVVFAKLADRGLTADVLQATAARFLFNAPIPFDREVEVSRAEIPRAEFDLANTAAGFGAVHLSALHGALLAAIIANGGLFVPPVLVERAEGAPLPARGAPQRVVDAQVAAALAEMMRNTVTEGTARKAFRRAGAPLRDVAVAGKTGSLADRQPFRDYSWFVGFAPIEHPQVAVATVIVNGPMWRVRAPAVAKDALAAYFADRVASGGGPVKTVRTAAAR